jgi:hypothetical protein
MYGMVNKGVADLVINRYGEEKWKEILDKAKVETEAFISMESYPDEVTYSLIGATSEVLKISTKEVLELFGEYWISFTAQEGYGHLMDMAGANLTDFLKNLDRLHSSVGHIMPKLNPPSFKCTDIKPDSLKLHHYSDRPGLEDMVTGLIKGLGKRFKTKCEVTLLESKTAGSDHNVFLVEWDQPAS